MPDTQPVRIDVVSDVVCPWCFIGKHRLEKALALRPAVAVGLDADTVREGLASDQDVAQIEQEALSAKEAGIEGVPCFIFGGKFAVSGAQSPEYLAEAIDRMAQAAQSDAAE